jgi:hypothetical protein
VEALLPAGGGQSADSEGKGRYADRVEAGVQQEVAREMFPWLVAGLNREQPSKTWEALQLLFRVVSGGSCVREARCCGRLWWEAADRRRKVISLVGSRRCVRGGEGAATGCGGESRGRAAVGRRRRNGATNGCSGGWAGQWVTSHHDVAHPGLREIGVGFLVGLTYISFIDMIFTES